ncbi:hypothetical protein PPTG_21676 [Phytophthora nicotianae INRA-310]|uniref:Uncharacterized protein n=1 Tax=Phytophthora nicotianae (strain INRA-310) TaxID=761204 RepID=W2QYZ5_PHYN3|nr:hypothetical protein PPTG_21676 [Phytophthora nicotianae INRA-310]ETN17684.1 hypothetical protein PPTG_21676 [Phytophthora nicotianae INRA-310]
METVKLMQKFENEFVLEMLEKYPAQLEDPCLRDRSMEHHWEVA